MKESDSSPPPVSSDPGSEQVLGLAAKLGLALTTRHLNASCSTSCGKTSTNGTRGLKRSPELCGGSSDISTVTNSTIRMNVGT